MSRTRYRKNRRKRRKRSTRKRPKRRKRRRHRRRTQKAGKKSVFKKYNKDHWGKIFENEIYFPQGAKKAVHYNKNSDEIVISWIEELLSAKSFIHRIMNVQHLTPEEISILLHSIKRCSKEIYYDKIRANKNFIDKNRLQCMGIAALIVATKVILEYDWHLGTYATGSRAGGESIKYASYITDSHCKKDILLKMEIDMLKTTNFRTCYEVQKRLGEGNIPRWPKTFEQKMTLTPKQLEKHQLRYDIGRNVIPEGWGMHESWNPLHLGRKYFFNPTTNISKWKNPMREGQWRQTSPGAETWEEGVN